MSNVFDSLKMIRVNHRGVASEHMVITDVAGKPNGLLTELLRDTINNVRLFLEMDQINTVDEVLNGLAERTPLPNDVLDEYAKILKEPVVGINFAPQKRQIELIVGG